MPCGLAACPGGKINRVLGKKTQDLIQSRLLDSWLLQAVSMRTRSRLMVGERRWGEKCRQHTLFSHVEKGIATKASSHRSIPYTDQFTTNKQINTKSWVTGVLGCCIYKRVPNTKFNSK
jgi:hypothetical protein